MTRFLVVARSLVALLSVIVIALGLPAASAASDVDLGSPTTIEGLLASPEYIEGEHGDIARLYQAFFGRTPDVVGLVYWIDQYEDGAEMADLAWAFSASTEFRSSYGSSLTSAAFLEIVYSNVLGRGYDQAGFDYWLGQMRSGLARPETVLWIAAGGEFRANYPFAGTFPDVTSALIQDDDVAQLSGERIGSRGISTVAEIATQPVCSRLRVLHSNEFYLFHGRTDRSESLVQVVYAFSTVAAAQAAVANHRRLAVECSSEIIPFDDGSSLRSQYWPSDVTLATGDDSVAVDARWTWSSGSTWSYRLYVVRNDNVVTVTDHTIRGGTLPDSATGGGWVQLTSDRMQTLLSL